MDLYKIVPKGSLEHDLRKIDRLHIPRILDAIENLAENPFPIQSRKMKGAESSYRLQVGDYREIYQVDTEKKVIIIYHVRHRKEAYKRQNGDLTSANSRLKEKRTICKCYALLLACKR